MSRFVSTANQLLMLTINWIPRFSILAKSLHSLSPCNILFTFSFHFIFISSCGSTLVTSMKLDGQVIAAMLWERPFESLAAPRKKNENVLVWAHEWVTCSAWPASIGHGSVLKQIYVFNAELFILTKQQCACQRGSLVILFCSVLSCDLLLWHCPWWGCTVLPLHNVLSTVVQIYRHLWNS